jgi:hypothetical protein
MPAHDIVDNRREKLVDQINQLLGAAESERFAVDYFFPSRLEAIARRNLLRVNSIQIRTPL